MADVEPFKNPKSLTFNVRQAITAHPNFYYIVAVEKLDSGKENHYYLHGDGQVYYSVLNDLGRWGTNTAAEMFLDNQVRIWAALKTGLSAATCTCDSFSLFSQGCTCGFLKRTGNGC